MLPREMVILARHKGSDGRFRTRACIVNILYRPSRKQCARRKGDGRRWNGSWLDLAHTTYQLVGVRLLLLRLFGVSGPTRLCASNWIIMVGTRIAFICMEGREATTYGTQHLLTQRILCLLQIGHITIRDLEKGKRV